MGLFSTKQESKMGISRDKWHKRRKTGGRMAQLRKKRKFELGRPPAMTKLGSKRIHTVRTMGGNKKYEARKKTAKVEGPLEEQFSAGRVLAKIASRPGKHGRADGYILEGKELDFYLRKVKSRKGK